MLLVHKVYGILIARWQRGLFQNIAQIKRVTILLLGLKLTTFDILRMAYMIINEMSDA